MLTTLKNLTSNSQSIFIIVEKKISKFNTRFLNIKFFMITVNNIINQFKIYKLSSGK